MPKTEKKCDRCGATIYTWEKTFMHDGEELCSDCMIEQLKQEGKVEERVEVVYDFNDKQNLTENELKELIEELFPSEVIING